jgi:hypothetical protein
MLPDYCKSHLTIFATKSRKKRKPILSAFGNLANFFLESRYLQSIPGESEFKDVFCNVQDRPSNSQLQRPPFRQRFRDFMTTARQQFDTSGRCHEKTSVTKNRSGTLYSRTFFLQRKIWIFRTIGYLQADAKQQKFNSVEFEIGRLSFSTAEKGKIA